MPLIFNLRHLEKHSLALEGELPIADLDLGELDELIRLPEPLSYRLMAQAMGHAVLVQGRLELRLVCECARCLRPFDHRVVLPEWACHLPLEGEDRVAVHNDCVDLTPYVREDILLAFPQHPLCDPRCSGLPSAPPNQVPRPSGALDSSSASAWAELNKLKL